MNLRTAVDLLTRLAHEHPEHLDDNVRFDHTDIGGVDTLVVELVRHYGSSLSMTARYALNERSHP